MSHRFSKTLALSQLAKFVLPAAVAAFLALGSSPARADDAAFQASYHGQSSVSVDEDSGKLLVDANLPGDATFLPASIAYFNQAISPSDATQMNGIFMLVGGENGTVFGTYQGTQSRPDPDGWVQLSGSYSIPDGWLSGFGAAVGSGAISGAVNLNTGEMAMQLIGSVSPATPSPN